MSFVPRHAAAHDHADHADHDHGRARAATARGASLSLLRMSALGRLAGALALSAFVWLAVWWALR